MYTRRGGLTRYSVFEKDRSYFDMILKQIIRDIDEKQSDVITKLAEYPSFESIKINRPTARAAEKESKGPIYRTNMPLFSPIQEESALDLLDWRHFSDTKFPIIRFASSTPNQLHQLIKLIKKADFYAARGK